MNTRFLDHLLWADQDMSRLPLRESVFHTHARGSRLGMGSTKSHYPAAPKALGSLAVKGAFTPALVLADTSLLSTYAHACLNGYRY